MNYDHRAGDHIGMHDGRDILCSYGAQMTSKWKFFFPAVLLGGYLLVSRGAPLLAVILGCGVAALLTWLVPSHHANRSH